MKGTVNPFEPWRPVVDRIPPPLHVGRPWRPAPPPPVRKAVEEPPFVEPVKPQPRNKPPERPKQLQGRTATSAPRRTPISQLAALVLFGVYGILVLVVLGVAGKMIFDITGGLCGTHTSRVIALGASMGLFIGMAFYRRRDWYTRLTWMAAALSFAGIALWFVPTTHGINLWSAYRQVEQLRTLPAGAVAEYQQGAAARQTLVEEFPAFTADMKAAEQAWLRRTVEEAIENADRQLNQDPDAVLAHLQQLDKELPQLDDSVRKELASARRRAVQACLKVAQQP